jgi:uncharacterized protein (DUF1501 family)
MLPMYKKNKTLVCIFQRGAMDGLMAVTPFADPALQLARPGLFMRPTAGEGGLFNLDDRYAMHPSLKSLFPYFNSKKLAVVHGVGSPNTTRSHFDAQDYMESGTPFAKGTASGWLNRAVGLLNHAPTPFSAVSVTSSLPRSLYGDVDAIAINNLQDFSIQLKGNPMAAGKAATSFEELYDQTTNELLNKTGKESFEALKILKSNNIKNYQPANGAVYPNSALGNSLKQIATLIKMDVGLEVGFAESGGWDTHFNQGTTNGIFARNLKDFSDSIAAFWQDLGERQSDVTLMTMTEFGRTVAQNGTGGTDHGRASCLFVLGNDVAGGKVYSNIGSLAKNNLEDGRDLPVTTDFRAVFSAVAENHLQLKTNGNLFPDWSGASLKMML